MRYGLLLLFCLLSIAKSTGQSIGIDVQSETQIMKAGKKFVIKDLKGNTILSGIDSVGEDAEMKVYILKKNLKYGMYSFYGKQIIPVKFDKIERFYDQFWLVQINEKTGVYNSFNKNHLPAIFDQVTHPDSYNRKILVKSNSKFGMYNEEFDQILPTVYDRIDFKRGMIEMQSENHLSFFINGKIVRKNLLADKAFRVFGNYLNDSKYFYPFEDQGKIGIIDENDSIVLKPSYTDVVFQRNTENHLLPSVIFLVQKDKKWGMVDFSNQPLVPFEYESIEFANSDYLIVGRNGVKQFYDLKSKHLLDSIVFDKYTSNLGKYSCIEKDGQETLVENATMKLVFPFIYELIIYQKETNSFSVKLNKKHGIIDSAGKEIIPIIYDEPVLFSCGNKIVVKRNGEYGIIDRGNRIVQPFSNRTITAYDNGFEIQRENSFETDILDCDLKKIVQK